MVQKQTHTKPEEIKRVIPLAGGGQLSLSRPLVMGILNVTPDSFFDGGKFVKLESAVAQAQKMIAEDADIIDIGGESTRPGAEPIDQNEEQQRVVPVIEALRQCSDVCISVDTTHARTAEVAVEAGARIINDVSAMRSDPDMVALAARLKLPVVLMHMQGTPRDMQKNPSYVDCVAEVTDFFRERIEFCRCHGVDKSKIILDPGIGFGKRLSDNLEILANISEFKQFGLPVLVGASRKSFIGMLHSVETAPEQRLGGSIAAAVTAIGNGADIVRVHDVGQTVQALKVFQGIRSAE